MDMLFVLLLAVFLDIFLGDPPNAIHPVAWMGKIIDRLEKLSPKHSAVGQFAYGIFITLFTAALFTTVAHYLLGWLHNHSTIVYIIIASILLKITFSMRGLRREALKIRALLLLHDLSKTRFELRGLVSRDTKNLDVSLMASAAVESVAEGCCDSLVAPLFFYLIFGIPGAIAYRVINTVDSMIGYHGKYEYLGKFAARFDDVLNFIPARLSALVLVCAAAFRNSARRAWETARREHSKTESPNAGWPMAAMAGALCVRLEKPGYYVLGIDYPPASVATIGQAVGGFFVAAIIWIIFCLAVGGLRFAIAS